MTGWCVDSTRLGEASVPFNASRTQVTYLGIFERERDCLRTDVGTCKDIHAPTDFN